MTTAALIGPAIAALLAVGGWLIAQSRDDHGLPRRSLVNAGQWLAMAGLLLALLVLPTALPPITYAAALAGVLLVGLLLVRGAGRLAIGWTTAAETITAAAMVAWSRPQRVFWSLLAFAGGLTLAVWLAGRGEPAAGLLGAAVALAPVRWWLPAGYARETAQTGIEKSMAGVLHGGLEWDRHEADLRGAPVMVGFRSDSIPDRVSYSLPPGWRAKQTEDLEEEIKARLSRWGTWLVDVKTSDRWAVAERVDPLPEVLPYDGEVATDRGEVVVGMARLSRRAAKARGARYGSVLPFIWDARIAPHGLVVGTTGAGKSSTNCVIITSWCRNPTNRAVLLDPAAVEFGPYRGRQGVLHVAETVETMTAALREVDAELRRRLDLCNRAGVKNVWSLPRAQQPPSWLVVVDEVMDYLDKTKSTTDEAKAENEMRAEAADIIQRLEQLARKADIHLILAGQRLDKDVVSGRTQNNSPFRCLTGVQEAEPTERNMIKLAEVEPEDGVPGRGVAKTVRLPESEVQFTYLEPDDMPDWLPEDDSAEREWAALSDGDKAAKDDQGQDNQTAETKPAKRPGSPRDSDQDSSDSEVEDEDDKGPSGDPIGDLDFDPLVGFDED